MFFCSQPRDDDVKSHRLVFHKRAGGGKLTGPAPCATGLRCRDAPNSPGLAAKMVIRRQGETKRKWTKEMQEHKTIKLLRNKLQVLHKLLPSWATTPGSLSGTLLAPPASASGTPSCSATAQWPLRYSSLFSAELQRPHSIISAHLFPDPPLRDSSYPQASGAL